MTTIKEAVLSTIEQYIDQQNAKGMKNYGQTLDDCPVDDYNWQNMIIEELIDALQYQQKEIRRLKFSLNLQELETAMAEDKAKHLKQWREGAEQVIKNVAELNEFISTNGFGVGRWGESVTHIAMDELKRLQAENEKLKEELKS